MKFKSIIAAAATALAVLAGCEETQERFLDEVRVSSSYVALPIAGGEDTVKVVAKTDWVLSGIPDWVKVAPTSGSAGKFDVIFKAKKSDTTRTAVLSLDCYRNDEIVAQQTINLMQMANKVELPVSTVAQVLAGEDGKQYRLKGVAKNIYNKEYGNWYLKDNTGEILVYGTLYEGVEKKFEKLGLEPGDSVTIEGPRTTYGKTVEIVNATVISIKKSLISLARVEPNDTLDIAGGEVTVVLACKGDGVSINVPDDAKSWLLPIGVKSEADSARVTFNVLENTLGDRSATVTFSTTSKGTEYTAEAKISQKGSIIDATAAEINAAADDGLYRLTGYISEDTGSKYGNIYVTDATGTVYVYGVLNGKGESQKWLDMGIAQGDIITLFGKKTTHKGNPQLMNASVESFKSVDDITVAEFVTKKDDEATYFRLTGTVDGLKDGDAYGNFNLKDESGSVYVYGLLAGWGGPKKEFQKLGIANGDKIVIVGAVGSHDDKKQVVSAFFVSKVEDTPVDPVDPASSETILISDCFTGDADSSLEDGKNYTWGTLSVTYTKNNTSSPSKYSSSDKGFRFYKGDILTFDAGSKTITSIVFTTYGGKNGPLSADKGSFDANTCTWTGEASKVAFTADSQMRFNKLVVTYKK